MAEKIDMLRPFLSFCARPWRQPQPQSGFHDPVDCALQASEGTFRCVRMQDDEGADAVAGAVRWMPGKSIWISTMTLTALLAGPLFFTWGALVLFLATTTTTVCLGHALCMHRRLIHRSYDCPLWLERLFVAAAVLWQYTLAGTMSVPRE